MFAADTVSVSAYRQADTYDKRDFRVTVRPRPYGYVQ